MSNLNFNQLKKLALKRYFSRMNERQQEAVFNICGSVQVLAGAGSGKTTVIVNRIANMINFGNAFMTDLKGSDEDSIFLNSYINGQTDDIAKLKKILAVGCVKPWNIMAITFTNKAANELKTRLFNILGEPANDIMATTFHSACVRILRREISNLGYNSNFTIYDSDDSQRVLKACLVSLDISDKTFPPKSILNEISTAKYQLQKPEDILKNADGDYRKSTIAKIYNQYQKSLISANAVDFDDIITLTVELFQQFPDILERYQDKFRYIMVDEYQDTNYSQYQLVEMLSKKYKNICVVGDDDQSIYKFRGATIENILNFENDFANCVTIRLEQNYRSTQCILDAANSVIKRNKIRKDKALWTDGEEGEKIHLYKAQDEKDEARFVAETILKNVKNGGKYNDNVILYRMNAQANSIEKALIQNGISYKVLGGLRFYERKEIKDMIAYLSVINNNNDLLRLKRIINEPKRGIGDATLTMLEEVSRDLSKSPVEIMRNASDYPLLSKKAIPLKNIAKFFDTMSENADKVSLDTLLDLVLGKSGYLEHMKSLGDEGAGRLENINELKSSMKDYQDNAEEPSLSGFLEEISLYADVDKLDENEDCAILMTIHSSKGLEFNNVFIVGLEDGVFPSNRVNENEEELEEERRLAYVAITRARKKLYLSNASQRMIFGTTNRNFPSRFIKEIRADLIEKEDNTIMMKQENNNIVTTIHSMSLQQQLAQKKAVAAAAQKQSFNLNIGDRVKHNVFGEGEILSIRKMANDAMIEVNFEKVGTKKLMANVAKVQKI